MKESINECFLIYTISGNTLTFGGGISCANNFKKFAAGMLLLKMIDIMVRKLYSRTVIKYASYCSAM